MHEKVQPMQSECDVHAAEAMLRFAALYLEEGLVPLAAALPAYPSFIHTPHTAAELKALEEQHAVLDLYVWLAYRLPLQFRDQDAAVAERALLAERISQGLTALSRFHVPRVPRPRAKQYRHQEETGQLPGAPQPGQLSGASPPGQLPGAPLPGQQQRQQQQGDSSSGRAAAAAAGRQQQQPGSNRQQPGSSSSSSSSSSRAAAAAGQQQQQPGSSSSSRAVAATRRQQQQQPGSSSSSSSRAATAVAGQQQH
ncbi:hypothetical protein QJQ45_007021 [Haematococcus lacustris]|nr:hypothetical protein QJQ45_007021 [Haematococcus lacustris]